MSYTPNSASVYLAAFAGCMSGLAASGKFAVNSADSGPNYARMADAYAQQLDTAWAMTAGVPATQFQKDVLRESSEAVWTNRSQLVVPQCFYPDSYKGLCKSIVALMIAGNSQVVSYGIDPNADAAETTGTVTFSFNSPSPMALQSLAPGQVINRAAILVETPFDDTAASVSLGTSTTPGLFTITPSNKYTFDDSSIVPFYANDLLLLTITPGASTKGGGVLVYKVSEPY